MLKGLIAIDTGPFVVPTAPGTGALVARWANPYAGALDLRASKLWWGVLAGGRADLQALLWADVADDGQLVNVFQADAYADARGISEPPFVLPAPMRVPEGAGLLLQYQGTAFPVETQAHCTVCVWFERV